MAQSLFWNVVEERQPSCFVYVSLLSESPVSISVRDKRERRDGILFVSFVGGGTPVEKHSAYREAGKVSALRKHGRVTASPFPSPCMCWGWGMMKTSRRDFSLLIIQGLRQPAK